MSGPINNQFNGIRKEGVYYVEACYLKDDWRVLPPGVSVGEWRWTTARWEKGRWWVHGDTEPRGDHSFRTIGDMVRMPDEKHELFKKGK